MSIKSTINDAYKEALRNKDQDAKAHLTLIRAAIADLEKNTQASIDDSAVIDCLNTMIKKRRKAIELFLKADRQALADNEQQEIQTITSFLPASVDQAVIDEAIEQACLTIKPQGPKDMGKIMTQLKSVNLGHVNWQQISQQVKQRLSDT